jgi:hypothetical protein
MQQHQGLDRARTGRGLRGAADRIGALLAALAACAATIPAHAADLASSTASSASSAGSASVGSASDSLRQSSASSTGGKQAAAAGAYRIADIAPAPGRAGQWRLLLQAADGNPEGGQWELTLPQALAKREALAPGQLVHAAPQAYGTAFARAPALPPFFLVLADEWQRELPAHPVDRAPARAGI